MNGDDLVFLLDSSVLVKLFHRQEVNSDLALLLREGHLGGGWEIRIADLVFYELANALHYVGKYSADEIIEGIQSLLSLELRIYDFDARILHSTLALCQEKKLSIYDAYLVALAKREQLTFITADEKLCRKFHSDSAVLALEQFSVGSDEEN